MRTIIFELNEMDERTDASVDDPETAARMVWWSWEQASLSLEVMRGIQNFDLSRINPRQQFDDEDDLLRSPHTLKVRPQITGQIFRQNSEN